MSDILFWWKGMFFAFEVKTVDEYNWISRNIDKIKSKAMVSKKEAHVLEQLHFLGSIKKAGGHAHFVCSLDQVKEILKNALLSNDG